MDSEFLFVSGGKTANEEYPTKNRDMKIRMVARELSPCDLTLDYSRV